MPEIADIFNDPCFSLASMTAAIEILPNVYNRILAMGLYAIESISTRQVMIEEMHGVLNLLLTQPLGAPGTQAEHGRRKVRSFAIPFIPHDDVILPGDVAGVRAFGSASVLETVAGLVNTRLQKMKKRHDLMHEWMRIGGLKGVILDADGSVLYDLFKEFDITKKEVDFALSTKGTDVRAKCLDVKRHIEEKLMGEMMTGVRVLVSKEFYNAFTAHPNVEKAFINWNQAQDNVAGDKRKGFEFGGVIFEEYAGSASGSDGKLRRFIDEGVGHAFPEGTGETFRQFVAPGDFTDTVNTLGQVYYARQEPRAQNRGVDLHTQSSILPLCLRPAVLVELRA